MATIAHSIDIRVPVRVAYDHWTRFEEYPKFMRHVKSVRQLDDRRLHWRVDLGGQVREFRAEITEQEPDQRIAWQSTGGVRNRGTVTFHRIDDSSCRVNLQLEIQPEGLLERLGTFVGVPRHDVVRDMQRFAVHATANAAERGGWRGTIHGASSEPAADAVAR
jgi:uncharacterized membrane protein